MSKLQPVLLVEDDLDLHESLKEFLMVNQVEVNSAFNGKEALEMIFAKEDLGCVILDLMMPIKDGYEVLEELNQKGKLPSLHVIILSAAVDANLTAKKYNVEIVPKPIDLSLLLKFLNPIEGK